MNKQPARTAAGRLYNRLVAATIKVLAPFLGVPVTPATGKELADASRALVTAARTSAQNLAYADYSAVVGGADLAPKLPLHRFTPQLWQDVVTREIGDFQHVTAEVIRGVGMQADSWARDAEWGTRYAVAAQDPRIDRVARVDFNPPTCPFCTLLNSRGAVYLSLESGAATLHLGDTCTLILVPSGAETYPGAEHTQEALRRYTAAREAVGGDPKDIMRELGSVESAGVVRKNVDAAVATAVQDQTKAVQKRISALERMSPRSESAKKYRDDQLAAHRNQLAILESR